MKKNFLYIFILLINYEFHRTTKRSSTFYDGAPSSLKGVCHIPMHTPFCPETREASIFGQVYVYINYNIYAIISLTLLHYQL